ncbi:TPA: tail fiber assembly protein [Salmonella enterica]
MQNYKYSASTNAFYANTINYPDLPEDALGVEDSVFTEFAASKPPDGKMRVAGSDGMPAWGDVPEPTQEQITTQNTAVLNRLLVICSATAFPLQSRVDAGTATDDQTATLAALKQYSINLTNPDIVDLTKSPLQLPAVPPQITTLFSRYI